MKNPTRIIFHIDMDAFYASIEQRDNPALKGKPVIIGALPGRRGVVSTASYEARRFGIHSAMPISQAYARCPQGVYLRPRMSAYAAESEAVMEVLRSFSPAVEQVSIDEAFVDMTGTGKLWGPADRAARELAQRVTAATELTASIGIAPNKFLAKIASDLHKPAGITTTPFTEDRIIEWLAPLPVSRIWGVGAQSQVALAGQGVHTIGDLQGLSLETLQRRFGKQGLSLYDLCRGRDSRPVEEGDDVKSISREHTYDRDSRDHEQWRATLLSLAGDVGRRARRRGLKGHTVVLTYRTPDFKRHSRRRTLEQPTNLSRVIFDEAVALLLQVQTHLHALRLIGVGITNFGEASQTNLFDDPERDEAWQASEEAMDDIVSRFGDGAILRGGEVGDDDPAASGDRPRPRPE